MFNTKFGPSILLAGLLCFLTTITSTTNANVPLPVPDGLYKLGTTTAELIDYSRTNYPFNNSTAPRKLMISVFYPVTNQSCVYPYPWQYMSSNQSDFENSELVSEIGFPFLNYASLETSMCGKLADRGESLRKYPVILFSPGLGASRLFYSVIAQSVAGSGYIVVTIDHPYDVDIVEFTDGSIVYGYSLVYVPTDADAEANEALAVRVKDVDFVLSELSTDSFARNHLPSLTCDLDVRKVGIYGHSIGGATAAAAMMGDDRLAGGLNLDGEYFGPVIQQGLDRPFLQFGSTGHNRYNFSFPDSTNPDLTWGEIWPKLTSFKLELSLNDSQHNTFTDLPLVLDTFGIPNSDVLEIVGTVDAMEAFESVSWVITTFFDFVLKEAQSARLLQVTSLFPVVTVI